MSSAIDIIVVGGDFMFTYENLRRILRDRGISMRQLSQGAGISTNCTVSLNNDRSVSIDRLALVCIYLDIRIEDAVTLLPSDNA